MKQKQKESSFNKKIFEHSRRVIEETGCPIVTCASDFQEFRVLEADVAGFVVNTSGNLVAKVLGRFVSEQTISNQLELAQLAKQAGYPFAVSIAKDDVNNLIWMDTEKQIQLSEKPKFHSDMQYVTDLKTVISIIEDNFVDWLYHRAVWGAYPLYILADMLLARYYLYKRNELFKWDSLDIQSCQRIIEDAYLQESIIGDLALTQDTVKDTFSVLLEGLRCLSPVYENYNQCFADLVITIRQKEMGESTTAVPVRDLMVRLAREIAGNSPILLDPAVGIGFTFLDIIKAIKPSTGISFESNPNVCKLTKIIAVISGFGTNTSILCENFLTAESWGKDADLVVLDPPLGGKVQSKEYENYEVVLRRRSKVIDIVDLMLEKAIRMACPGGHIISLVPEGILFSSASKTMRDIILEKTMVKAIISLPSQALKPFSSVKTSIIVLQKKRDGERPPSQVFLGKLEQIEEIDIDKIVLQFMQARKEGLI